MYNMYNMEYIKKTITITKEQDEWIKEDCINLSRLVQKELNKKMKK